MISNETGHRRLPRSGGWCLLQKILPVCLLVAGCQTVQDSQGPTLIQQQIADAMAEQQTTNPMVLEVPPAVVQQALIPPMPEMITEEETELRFDLAVNNAPAREFFIGLMEGSHWNVVVSPQITGKITLNLKDVSVTLVMELVRDIYGYEYSIKENVYQIYPAMMKTVMFPVNYLNVKRSGSSVIRVNSGEVADNYSSGPTNNRGSNANNQNRQAGGNNSNNQYSTQIETRSENDFWGELTSSLQILVSGSPEAKVFTNPQANMAVVHALPKDLRIVSKYLHAIQEVMHRQVLLEAKILEVILGDSFQAGIDWSSIARLNSGNEIVFSQNGMTVKNPDPSNLLSGVFNASYGNNSFDMMIDLLSTQGLVQVLSSPRISTLNNQKAVIKVGTDEFFVTDISSTTVAGAGSSTTSPDVTLTPFFSGIALDVTPQIDGNGNIILHVHPSISEVVDQEKILTLGDEQITLPLARSTIRESDSIIRARSGQVVVIGGLMQTQISDSDSGIPFLKDLPVLGNLFKQRNMKNRKTELIILIRPIIIEDSTWQDYLKDSQQRLGIMGGG